MIRRLFQVTVCSLTAVTSFRELSIPECSVAKQLTLLAIIKAKADQANELGRRPLAERHLAEVPLPAPCDVWLCLAPPIRSP